ncbi:MAG TPA: helix-turn-helix domain-containing protein [Candidatus Dormibacteraeota bacterium]
MEGRAKQIADSDVSAYASIFSALGDPVRMDIVRMIARKGELACTVLDDTLPISKSTISYHIKILYRSGLISVRHEGRFYFYKLRRENFARFLPNFVGRLRSADAAGGAEVAMSPRPRRPGIASGAARLRVKAARPSHVGAAGRS